MTKSNLEFKRARVQTEQKACCAGRSRRMTVYIVIHTQEVEREKQM